MSDQRQELTTDDYRRVLTNVLKVFKPAFDPSKTTLVVWRDEAHLREWMALSPSSDGIRCLKLPREHLSMLEIDHPNSKEGCLVCVVYGVKEDLSDMRAMYTLLVKGTPQPRREYRERSPDQCTNCAEKTCGVMEKQDMAPLCWRCYYDFVGP